MRKIRKLLKVIYLYIWVRLVFYIFYSNNPCCNNVTYVRIVRKYYVGFISMYRFIKFIVTFFLSRNFILLQILFKTSYL